MTRSDPGRTSAAHPPRDLSTPRRSDQPGEHAATRSRSISSDGLLGCSVDDKPWGSILHFEGEVDLQNARVFRRYVLMAIEQSKTLVLDFSAVQYMDTSGLTVIELCGSICRERNLRLVVVLNPLLRRLAGVVGLNDGLDLVDTFDAAQFRVGANCA